MINSQFFQKVLFHKLFQLIRKHGIALVLQGLIEFAETDKKDPRMKLLAEDMQRALTRYKNGKRDAGEDKWVSGTWELLHEGSRVRRSNLISPTDKTNGTIVSANSTAPGAGIIVQWDNQPAGNIDHWTLPYSLEVLF